MNRDDVRNLADLARLSLTDEQCDAYQKDFESILGYIDTINKAEIQDVSIDQVLKNVVREDEEAYEPGEFTEDILALAPHSENGYIKVDKIL